MPIKNIVKKMKSNNNYRDYAVSEGNYENSNNVADKKVPFAVVESYKTMRTNLMFLLAQENGKVISFTSSNASEGKSTTSVNIAIAFSQLNGKVLVIDADLRRSSIHKKLRIENDSGLSSVLAGFEKFEDVKKSANPNLDVLTAGPIPPNPSELLGSAAFKKLIEELREKYDYIIIDTPPLNIVTDALLIGPHTDGMVLVVRDAYTPRESIRAAINAAKFANIKILGAMLNGANPKNSRRYSYRRYAYKYGYKYSSSGYGRYGGYGYGNYSSHSKSKR